MDETSDAGSVMPPRVIAVGSSAGGLDALTRLFATAVRGRNLCFVVAQHLAPTAESHLPELLDDATPLTVVSATDGAPVAADTVFVAPPGCDLGLYGGVLRVVAPDGDRRPWPSIDRLFTSVALSMGSDAVAIVLSGTGDDGSSGVESIQSAGGMVVIQEPATAAFPEMPGAGLATGSVDLVLPVDQMLAGIARVVDSPNAEAAESDSASNLDDSVIEHIIAVVRDATGVDFSGYKQSTLIRQIQRRQRLVDLPLEAYLERVEHDSAEAIALSRNVLVSVTAFFRDSEVWDAFGVHLQALVDGLGAADELRIWVPGCASGEEAFTVAMLAADALSQRPGGMPLRLRVFATDLDERALVIARRARYSDAAVAAVPEHLRERWMRPVDTEWEVVSELRETLVIARHNVAYDPPFPRIDVISLRNTMIYFQNHLQERVLQLCQFALVPGGMLILGQSERIPRVDGLFAVTDPIHRLYRRGTTSRNHLLPVGRYIPPVYVQPAATPASNREPANELLRQLLATVAPPSLILDDAETVIEVIGDVSSWCAVSVGRYTGHAVDLIRERYRPAVQTMLSQLRHSEPDIVTRVLFEPGVRRVEVIVARLSASGTGAVVSFRPLPDAIEPEPRSVGDGDLVVEEDLRATQDALQATIEDLSSSNEELQALNEELQASAEELQATSEEAQASNEELEATNEELSTLNSELQMRGEEMARLNGDLRNIASSLTSGLVIVDRELRVTRYTPLAVRLFSLIVEDIGRPLPAVPTTLPVPDLVGDLEATIRSRESRMRELSSDDRDLLIQIQPYVGFDDEVLGAIVVVLDVGDVADARRAREAAIHNLEQVAESVREVVWQRNAANELVMITSRVEEIYGLDRAAVLADPELLLEAVHADDVVRVRAAMASVDRRWHVTYRIGRPDGSVRWLDEVAGAAQGGGDAGMVIGSAIDVTEAHETARLAEQRTAVLDAVLNTADTGILILDADDRVLLANRGVAELTGYSPASLIGTPLTVLMEHDDGDSAREADPDGDSASRRIMTSAGAARQVTIEVQPVAGIGDDDVGRGVPGAVALVRDVSRMREISSALATREHYDLQTGLLTRNYLLSKTDELMSAGLHGIALLWIDLDGFKEVNDRFGHRAGDAVLATVATRLQQTARRYDIVGRLGGDEFALLVTRVRDVDSLDNLALRVLAAIREPIPLQDSLAYVSASVGVAIYPQDASDGDQLMHNADTAMYVAKSRGRDRHAYFAPEMNEAADARAAMRQRLGAAISRNEFELFYQPVVEVDGGAVVMMEALLRWRREGSVVSASEFIGHAVETGQMRALGRIVLERLALDTHEFHARLGQNRVPVAVNLSASELDERDITDWLLSWNPPGGLGLVVVEVTESVLLEPESRAIDTLALLRRLGATISIDDFGT
ncbi:MAG: diguanylate cyclase, partial [Corynebacteriales bacterium]|nr:diguanylate cyclase [Mycobacteriales bacterium]